MSFPSLLNMILFIQAGMVSLNTLLHCSSLVESAVDDDVAMDDTRSLSTHWVLGEGGCKASEISLYFSSDALLQVLTAELI